MRGSGALALLECTILAVVVVQAAKFQSLVRDLPNCLHDRFSLIRFDAGSVHSGIDIKEDAEETAAPLPHLLRIFDQNRNTDVGKLMRNFAHPSRVGSHQRVGDKNVGGSALTAHQQLERGCALEVADSAID